MTPDFWIFRKAVKSVVFFVFFLFFFFFFLRRKSLDIGRSFKPAAAHPVKEYFENLPHRFESPGKGALQMLIIILYLNKVFMNEV